MDKAKTSHPNEIVNFYLYQLRKLKSIGIGKKTEFGVVVTQTLIDITKKRMNQLVIKKINDEN